ncbi:MAG: cell wall metabolism sensor histidine kinase WalK [Bacteroidia bacterium]|nr:cell wall metabolism sensor histidine kinase WalK [Bacteroidia bacterium]
MPKKRLFWQLYASNFLIVFLALFAFTFLTTSSVNSILLRQVSADLKARAMLLEDVVREHIADSTYNALEEKCARLGKNSGTRITVILADGLVIADSDRPARTMENHAARPEVQDALHGRHGSSTRFSETVQQNAMYSAVPIRRGDTVFAVLRAAVPVHTVEGTIRNIQWNIVIGGIVITLLAGVVSLFISRNITRPIAELKQGARRFAEGDLDYRLTVPEAHELRDFAEVMNTMAEQLQDRISIIVRQNSEQDAVFSSMIEGVLAFDTEERLININTSAARMLSIQPERALGKSIIEIIRNVGLQRFVGETLASGKPIEGYITILEEQQERFLQSHGSLLRDQAGRVLGALVVLNDVTELRKLETVRRDFVANVSHELKTPITSIKGFVETLLDGALQDKEDTLRFLGIISRQADRLNSIIEDLLSLSRIEQGAEKEQIEFAQTAIGDVLASAVQSCQMDADAKRMTLLLDCPPLLRAEVNSALLEQALVNLVNNAMKYSEDGKRVWVQAAVQDDEHLTITVRDEGFGIEAEHLPRLFERFYRIDKARSRTMGGTGLGLAIVKHIVQAHHGQIEVSSSPGAGSTFVLRLPLIQRRSEMPLSGTGGSEGGMK